MKRIRTGRKGGTHAEGEQGFWSSYADMMSSFALILFFLMLLAYIQNLVTGNDLQNTQSLLEDTKIQLSDTLANLSDTLAELSLTQVEVEDAEDRLSQIQIQLEDATLELKGQQEELSTQQALIDTQEEYLAAANEEIRKMHGQMQTIAVLRLSILEQIQTAIVNATGDASKVNIGENGNIILNEGIFFDLGSAEIKPESAAALNQLIRVFTRFFAADTNAKYIDSIVISGHTDDTGTDEYNRTLSTSRANSVLNYLLSEENGSLGKYASYFCAAGYGMTRPVAGNDTEEGQAANRRIEISIILKDESIQEIVNSYLDLEVPGAEISTSAR